MADAAAALGHALARLESLVQEVDDPLARGRGQGVAALSEHVSVSIGVASLAGGISGPLELLMEADRALYRAKDQGKNRVMRERPTPWTSGRSFSV